MFDKLAASPLAVVVTAAREEARQRGDRRMGTEHLLLGLLHEPNSVSTRALGVDLDAAHAALDDLDRQALHAIGIDLAGFRPASNAVPSRKYPPLTSAAQTALAQAVKSANTTARNIETKHLLVALLARERPDPAAELMDQLGIDRQATRNRIDNPAT